MWVWSPRKKVLYIYLYGCFGRFLDEMWLNDVTTSQNSDILWPHRLYTYNIYTHLNLCVKTLHCPITHGVVTHFYFIFFLFSFHFVSQIIWSLTKWRTSAIFTPRQALMTGRNVLYFLNFHYITIMPIDTFNRWRLHVYVSRPVYKRWLTHVILMVLTYFLSYLPRESV